MFQDYVMPVEDNGEEINPNEEERKNNHLRLRKRDHNFEMNGIKM